MKKLIALLFIAALVISAVSCTQEATVGSNDSKTTAAKSAELTKEMEEAIAKTVNNPVAKTDNKPGYQLKKPAVGDEIAVLTIKDYGDIRIRLFEEEVPLAVKNFKGLIKNGYYDAITFHRIINNFMIQGGDPLGNGTGGESFYGEPFADEFTPNLMNLRGSIAMANSGIATNGSQFFINQNKSSSGFAKSQITSQYTNEYIEQYKNSEKEFFMQYYSQYGDNTDSAFQQNGPLFLPDRIPDAAYDLYAEHGGNSHLDGAWRYKGGHTVFGQVFAEDMEIVDRIAAVKTNENGKPAIPVVIEKAVITVYK